MNFLATVLIGFLVIAAVIAGMAIGVIAGREPIRGSCGGLGGGACELCTGTGRCRNTSDSGGES